jgi:hypothetical protein
MSRKTTLIALIIIALGILAYSMLQPSKVIIENLQGGALDEPEP